MCLILGLDQKRKAIQTGKFYYFDIGITNALLDIRDLQPQTDAFGRSFESWMLNELKAYASYRRTHQEISFWRSVNSQEVDFCVGKEIAIEVKTTRSASRRHCSGLLALKDEKIFKKYFLVTFDPLEATHNGITCLYWKDFIEKLWSDQIIK